LLEQGPRFAAEATRGSLLGIMAWASFCVAYAFCCLRMSWWWSTLVGWIAYFVIAWALLPLTLSVILAFVLVTVTLFVLWLIFPKTPLHDPAISQDRPDLWLRMATASVMVVTLTGIAKLLGPTRSGILTAFPAYTTILAVFTHRHGAGLAVQALKGVTTGLYTAATFFLVLSLCLTRLGNAWSFVWASAAALLVHAGSFAFVRRIG
jgi:hypothetical protein